MNLSNGERDFVEIYRDATRDKNTDMIIAINTIIQRLLEQQGAVPPDQISGFTKGEYKRSIKAMRHAQVLALRTDRPDLAVEYDLSIQYIRERCLHRVPTAA